MKLIIQIPCLDEAVTIGDVLKNIPASIPGFDQVETLVIDDGSSDGTYEAAKAANAGHILRFKRSMGLARAFMAGIDASLRLGADVIVNTDGDNQYKGGDIPKLVKPILEGKADIVVGERDIVNIEDFSPAKKILQRWGSWVVRQVSNTEIPDTTSGFRAISREAAIAMNVINDFTYTLETIIQAGKNKLAITHVPIGTNRTQRKSRLMKSSWDYIKKSVITIIRIYTAYEPLKVFGMIGGGAVAVGLILSLRFLYFYILGSGRGHVQSLILSAVLVIIGFQVALMGLLADAISANRRLIETLMKKVRGIEAGVYKNAQETKEGQGDKTI